jgi:hypothetical protein
MIVGGGYRAITIVYLYSSSKLKFRALLRVLQGRHLSLRALTRLLPALSRLKGLPLGLGGGGRA